MTSISRAVFPQMTVFYRGTRAPSDSRFNPPVSCDLQLFRFNILYIYVLCENRGHCFATISIDTHYKHYHIIIYVYCNIRTAISYVTIYNHGTCAVYHGLRFIFYVVFSGTRRTLNLTDFHTRRLSYQYLFWRLYLGIIYHYYAMEISEIAHCFNIIKTVWGQIRYLPLSYSIETTYLTVS